jgi:predicted AAA+ superfamily ATPase
VVAISSIDLVVVDSHRESIAIAEGNRRGIPIVAMTGPRQSGKTTLARSAFPDKAYVSLEDLDIRAYAEEDPRGFLARYPQGAVIDEVQRAPGLFKTLRVLIDREGCPARFLLLGSASPALLRQSSESLAGRVEIVEMAGFHLAEVGGLSQDDLWLRGGFPRALLAEDDQASLLWRRNFVRTVVERDMPQLGMNAASPAIQRFWAMLGHLHGQVWNAADPARADAPESSAP